MVAFLVKTRRVSHNYSQTRVRCVQAVDSAYLVDSQSDQGDELAAFNLARQSVFSSTVY